MFNASNNLKRLANAALLLAAFVASPLHAGPVGFLSDCHRCLQEATPASSPQPVVGRFGFLPPKPLRCTGDLYKAGQQGGNYGCLALTDSRDFSATQTFACQPYSACTEQGVYGAKFPVPVQRPLIEWGMPFYDNGPVPVSETWCGKTNLVQQKFYVYGDYRVGFAQNKNLAQEADVLAHRLNLELDYWITSTERVHAFIGPFQDGGQFMRIENGRYIEELELFSDNTDTLFFEGDLGQMVGGWENTAAPFDLPITAGLIPLLFQNGVWTLDAVWGAAATLPARNNPWLDWSNYDITFFAALDQVSTDAFQQAPHTGQFFGAHTFIESRGGYLEMGYAYVLDRHGVGRSYHNMAVSYTRRYANTVSNSVRVLVNTGQNLNDAEETADGVLVLVENSFLTKNPYNVIPYVNGWVGFDRPQPLARAAAFGGTLFNTGILFQTDALTGYPTLDSSGADTAGVAVGIDLIGDGPGVQRFPATGFDQQLIIEAAMVQAFGDPANRTAPGDQYGLGVRWQLPLSEAHLIRADAMYGFIDNARDISGARLEYRWKF